MEKEYNVDYFIEKFEAIPEDEWTKCKFKIGNKCCALGHCGAEKFSDIPKKKMAKDLENLFIKYLKQRVYKINDSGYKTFITAKDSVLAALKDIKQMMEPPPVKQVETEEDYEDTEQHIQL